MIGDFIRKMETNKDKNINQGLNAKLKKTLPSYKRREGISYFS